MPATPESSFFLSFIWFPLLCGFDVRWHTPPCSTVVHIISRQSLLFDVILYFVQPSSLMSSSLPSPLYCHYHRPPSHVVFISFHHMSIPLQHSFLYFLSDYLHFRCPSYSFISDLVQLRNSEHPSYRSQFCDLQCIFLCPLQHPCLCSVHQCWSVHLPLDLHVHYPVAQHSRHSLPPALHSVGDFRIQFSILRQRRYQVCACLHSLYCLSL